MLNHITCESFNDINILEEVDNVNLAHKSFNKDNYIQNVNNSYFSHRIINGFPRIIECTIIRLKLVF